jgi:putative lipoic acid-binding regulatory protein
MADSQTPKIEYPTDYCFKVMGRQGGDFSVYVRALFARLLATDIEGSAVVEHESSKGKYVSVSITVRLTSEEQRRHIYTQLHSDPRVVYYL